MALVATALPMGMVLAQSTEPDASSRVMHLWVDPHYGNDFLAWLHNPLPCDVADSQGKPLLHMSFPFRTVTAAVRQLRSVGLPRDGSAARWEYAIVHMLPGLYRNDSSYDPHLQRFGNGESFPIDLPARVSIQGTSALDTVIDLRRDGPAFRFGELPDSTGEGSFISNLSIYGAPGAAPDSWWQGRADIFSAIAVVSTAGIPTSPRIEGCFIYGNGIGIFVDAPGDYSVTHEVVVANCTLAWNGVGLWSGDQARAYDSGEGAATARLMLLNNIFDSSPPYDLGRRKADGYPDNWNGRPFPDSWLSTELELQALPSRSGFEGVRAEDLHVHTDDGPLDFNAYEHNCFNRGDAIAELRLPISTAEASDGRGPAATQLTGADITPYTGGTGGRIGSGKVIVGRGVLYVRDLFHTGINPSAGGTQVFHSTPEVNFDLSPGDFRLAPAVAPQHGVKLDSPALTVAVPGQLGQLNPLVERGYFGDFPVRCQNGMQLDAHPRTLSLGEGNDSWPFDDWKDFTDADGFGNQRWYDHPAYQGDAVDLGADELGDLLVAGYRFGTRTFTRNEGQSRFGPGSTTLQVDNRYVWILGPPDSLTGSSPASAKPCYSDNWWASPNYLSPQIPAGQFPGPWSEQSRSYYNPLVVDITPFLLPDAHPYNAVYIHRNWPSNPVWNYAYYPTLANPALYEDPSWPIVNPPGVIPQGKWVHPKWTVPGFQWLDNVPSIFPGHHLQGAVGYQPWATGGALGGARFVLGFSDWCTNWESFGGVNREADVLGSLYDDGSGPKPDWRVGPTQASLGVGGTARFSLEFLNPLFPGAQDSNIQTFMVWRQD